MSLILRSQAMDRRDFLRSTGGLAALATGCASAAASSSDQTNAPPGPERTYSFASPWVEHHAGLADDAENDWQITHQLVNGIRRTFWSSGQQRSLVRVPGQ